MEVSSLFPKFTLNLTEKKERRLILTLSFLIPALIMTCYFASRHMAPFGNSSLLTVDLGQQYVDFFAYFRHCLLHDPSGIFYTFQKALGGEMFGIWTYYLLSPFNLILLFFPDHVITSGILVITVLKYGAAGFTFAWLLFKSGVQRNWTVIGFATSYAMMGWMIANQLNLMWLDAVVILPLIVLGLLRLINGQGCRTYIIWLAALLIINYYMAYMVCLFSILFFIYEAISQYDNRQTFFKQAGRYIGSSLLAAGIAAVTLLPTWYSLSLSKSKYTVTNVKFKFEYFPLKMLSKLFLGGFNFSQMPKSMPNLFVGSVVLVGVVAFFIRRDVRSLRRWMALIITFVLLLSLCFQPLDLVWHAMQFPIWYPYRFSFVVSFWLIWLAANALQKDFVPDPAQILIMVVVGAAVIVYVWLNLKSFSFLSHNQVMIGGLFYVAAVCLVALPQKQAFFYQLIFSIFIIAEMTSNMVTSLNHITYVSQTEYGNYQQVMTKEVDGVTSKHKGFYRMTPTFMRTKNDPLSGQFNGGSVFSSTLEKTMPTFMGSIGQPDGDGFVAYTNGTELTDSLLNFRYLINQNSVLTGSTSAAGLTQSGLPTVSTRADLSDYKKVREDGTVATYKNPNALSMGFISSSDVLSLKNTTADPTRYQANLWASLTGEKRDQHLFTAENFNNVLFSNVKQQTKLTGAFLQKANLLKAGSVTLTFKPTSNDSYYLTMGANMDEDNVTVLLNGKTLSQYPTYRHTIVVNIANHDKGKTIKVQLNFKKSTLWLQNFTLYKLNNKVFKKSVKKLQAHPLKVTKHTQRSITGTVTAPRNNATLMTTIPYSKGWHVTVDGRTVTAKKAAGTFLALKLAKGKHTIHISYWPPLFNLGLTISLVCLAGCSGLYLWRRKRRHS